MTRGWRETSGIFGIVRETSVTNIVKHYDGGMLEGDKTAHHTENKQKKKLVVKIMHEKKKQNEKEEI